MKISFFLLIAISLCSCTESNPVNDTTSTEPDTLQMTEDDTIPNDSTDRLNTFLALGDSYTIGESVEQTKRWPVQLAQQLRDSFGVQLDNPKIIATTGWTTDELQAAIRNATLNPPYSLVSLLIGVNNQYRGYPIEQYRKEFKELLEQAISFAGHDTSNVFVVSIPDYGVTPFAANMDQKKIAEEIDLYNSIAKEYASEYGVKYFDITPISREAASNGELIAGDGLHPSGEMYSRWVDLILPWANQIFDE